MCSANSAERLIIFGDVVGNKTGKTSQGHILEGPENHLDEFSLISIGTGEPLKSFKQKRLTVVMFEEDSFGIW